MKAPLDKVDNLPSAYFIPHHFHLISFLTTSIFTEFDLQKDETDPELIEKLIKRAHDMAAEVIVMKIVVFGVWRFSEGFYLGV